MAVIAAMSRGSPPGAGGSGDPSPSTARTVFASTRAVTRIHLGRDRLADVRVGVLRVGAVGSRLTRLLLDAGADVTVADVDPVRAVATDARFVSPAKLLEAELDVLTPCGVGGVVRPGDAVACGVICGAANNQLGEDTVAGRAAPREDLYVPDVIANCGGIIHAAVLREAGSRAGAPGADHPAPGRHRRLRRGQRRVRRGAL